MKWKLSLLAFASLLTVRANAEETAFDKFFAPNSPKCVPVAAIEAAAKDYRPVSQETYRFIQALRSRLYLMNYHPAIRLN
jgi:hypothetical protein